MFGQRLRLARKRAGLSMQSLAQQMTPQVTAQAISKYESGKMMPSSAVLVGLGKALDVSLDFLMSAQVEALDGLEFRKHSRTSARDRAKAEAVVIDSLERYLAIEEILELSPPVDAFRDVRSDSVATEADIDDKADALRNVWQLGMDPIPSLCALLEDKGIKVIVGDLPDRINGLACDVLREGKRVAEAVVVSEHANVERKRFTLAHELAHRIIHSTGNPAIKLEVAMNRFAGAFLVPAKSLLEETGAARRRVTYHEIIRLKHTYGVSAAAMLMRLGQVGILRPASVQHAFATFARSWRKDEPEPIGGRRGFAAFEKPRRFEQLVWRAVGEELISPVRAATLLNQSLAAVEQQISGPPHQ
ncbi:MAG: XRE family transcriptional regulator [Immundisolibacterales bacterium]|nr:XRE family transcriptional regulator [Immundisolibacterales bacterium]